jgi:hypothetical protein
MPRKVISMPVNKAIGYSFYAQGSADVGTHLDRCVDSYDIAKASLSSPSRSYINIDTATSIRPTFTQGDYDYFRPEEAVPSTSRMQDVMRMCQIAYDKCGLIGNVIDLMGDFACQGISIHYPNKQTEKMLQEWFRHVNFVNHASGNFSERFLNTFYRIGTVPIYKTTAKLTAKNKRQLLRAMASGKIAKAMPDLDIDLDTGVLRNEVPWHYTIITPWEIEPVGGDIAVFSGANQWGWRINPMLLSKMQNAGVEHDSYISKLPMEFMDAIAAGNQIGNLIPLPADKFRIFFYKKDDWEVFPKPMIYKVLDQIILLKKMELGDKAALDGIISNVRIWQLGSLDHQLAPSPEAAARLANLLANNLGGGVRDLIWGPDLKYTESNSNAYKFFGKEKYEPVLNQIYAGLGIPPTLTGTATASGVTNNYISLKTLVERLEYGRQALMHFWQQEFEIVRQALGLRKPITIRFEHMTLSDETAEMKLIMDMVDRNIISEETLIERAGEIPALERARLKKEEAARVKRKTPQKAGPYHNPQTDDDLKKIALQSGTITPGQTGIELQPKKPGEKSQMDIDREIRKEEHKCKMDEMDKQHTMQSELSDKDLVHKDKDMEVMNKKMELAEKQAKLAKIKQKTQPKTANGRPKNKKDSTKRKTRVSKVRKSVKASDDTPEEGDGVINE